MKATPSGRITPFDPQALAYADGLTAASYIEPDGEDATQPQGIPQEPNWTED